MSWRSALRLSLGLAGAALSLGGPRLAGAAPAPPTPPPLRVLLVASAPTREFQFTRALFLREAEKKRARLNVYVQPPPGKDKPRPVAPADEPFPRLSQFPDHLGKFREDKADDRPSDLASYDVLIAFDPDWTRLAPAQLNLLHRWVQGHGGGLVLVAGPINTIELGRPGATRARLKPIAELYPVVLPDLRLVDGRATNRPWRLNFPDLKGAPSFLKLDWETFFSDGKGPGKKDAEPLRGFFNYYPVKGVKPGATVLATFSDPRGRLKDGKEQPYIVTMAAGKGRVVYLGSGEVWRLRQYREGFYDSFWTGLARYAAQGAGRKADEPKKPVK